MAATFMTRYRPSTDVPMLEWVPEVLAWRTAPSVREEAVSYHATLLAEAFERTLAGLPASADTDLLRATARALPDDSLARMVLAPESCRRLLYDKEPSTEFLIRSALAEGRRAGVADVPDGQVWTALGDRCFPGGFQAPVLSNGVVVDFSSPHAARLLRAYGHSPSSPLQVEVKGVVGKLEEALAVLAAVSPEAAWFFRTFVQVVIPWDHPGGPRRRASLSDTRWVGALACANALGVSELHLAEMLLHESVHSYLGIVEEQVPIIGDLESVRGMRVPSPWTGTPLHPRNFFHACFVWFALMRFWREASSRGVIDAAFAQRSMERAGAGFHSPVLGQALAQAAPHLSAPAQSVVPAFLSEVGAGRYD